MSASTLSKSLIRSCAASSTVASSSRRSLNVNMSFKIGSCSVNACSSTKRRDFSTQSRISTGGSRPVVAVTSNSTTSLSASRRTLFVQTATTPNPNSLQFIPGVPVLSSGGTHEFLDTKAALASPLALRLMGVDGVISVFYGPDFVSIQKDEETPWSIIKPEVFSIIMEHFSAGVPLFKDGSAPADDGESEDTRILETDSEIVGMIKDLLATRIRPSIMEDGGDLEYRGFGEGTDGLVRIKLKGSCRGCSSSEVTLKGGIERMLMHYIPEVEGVQQVLDQEEEIALDEFAKFEAKLEAQRARAE